VWRLCPSGLTVSVRGGSAVQLIATVRSRPSWNGGAVYLAPHSPPSGLAGPDPLLAGVWEGAVPFDSGKFLCKVSCPCPAAPAIRSSLPASHIDPLCVTSAVTPPVKLNAPIILTVLLVNKHPLHLYSSVLSFHSPFTFDPP
jgi:hypothetical protein